MRDNIDRVGNDAAVREAVGPDANAKASFDEGASRGTPGVDPVTGEVSGAGSGAGGSSPGEDYDDDHTAGSNSTK